MTTKRKGTKAEVHPSEDPPQPRLPDPRVRRSAMMTPSEPQPIGATLGPWQERLAKIAAQPLDPGVFIGDPHTETPEQARERVAHAALRLSERWRERLPEDYALASLDDLVPEVRETIERYLSDDRALTMVLAGGVGLGKTHAAYAIGNWYMARGGVWCEAYTVYDLLANLRPDGDPYTLDRVTNCGVLVLDDLGATKASPWAVETLTFILDQRVSRRRRTIVTTNVSEPELRAVWEDRLIDRMRDRSVVHLFHGKSRRGPAW